MVYTFLLKTDGQNMDRSDPMMNGLWSRGEKFQTSDVEKGTGELLGENGPGTGEE